MQREGGLLELRHHAAPREEVEVAALRGAAVLRVRLGERREVFALFGTRQDAVDLGARLLPRHVVGFLVDEQQDMAGAHGFALLEFLGVLLVELLHLVVGR